MSLAERRSGGALFGVDVELAPSEAVITLRGELDSWTQQLFVRELERVDERVGRIVLDLSGLTFIDVSSLALIHRSRIRAAQRGADLVLRSPSPHIMRVIELTELCVGAVSGP